MPVDSCRHAARRVSRLAEQLDEFSQQQAQRLERLLARCEQILEREEILHEMITSVQEERASWEQQRQKELRRMQDETARLIEAWRQVESEQRRLLAQPPAQSNGLPRELNVRRGQAEFHPVELGRPPQNNGEDLIANFPMNNQRINDCQANPNAADFDSALMQYQQLRRELQKHAQQRHPDKSR